MLIPRVAWAASLALAVAACSSSSTGSNTPTTPLPGTVTGLVPETWTWVGVDGTHCRDGSATGIGINQNPASDKLAIYLEGGGACFNATTCGTNPASFGAPDFAQLTASTIPGIFDRADPANPFKDWSFVYVPYCTGDVHAGNNPTGSVDGVGPQQFVGYANVDSDLKRIVPTFSGVKQVLLTGVSAGGFGAVANYVQVAKAFGSVPVSDLDDSGPTMDSTYLAGCLQDQLRTLWGLDGTLIADCGADCSDPTNYQIAYAEHVVKAYPGVPFGLMDSTDDGVITLFFGFGASSCTSFQALSADQFTAGLNDIRTKLSAQPNFGAFVFSGTDHTTLTTSAFDTRQAGGVLLTDWVARLVSGSVANVGP